MFRRAAILILLAYLPGLSLAQTVEARSQTAPQSTAKGPNADPVYRQLRQVNIGNESSSVNNFVLKRDAGRFTFKSGTFYFLAPVESKVTGAVFIGEGTFVLDPPTASEHRNLKLLTRESEMVEQFNEAVFRFTDTTYDEIKKAGGVSTSTLRNGTGLLDDSQTALRKKLNYKLSARILQDVLSPEPGGLFFAFIKGKRYNGKMLFAIDPFGVQIVAPEEIMLMTYDENKFGIWAAFHYAAEVASSKASSREKNALIQIERQKLDIAVDKSGRLEGTATTTFVAHTKWSPRRSL
jgi:hypothetical protein